MGTMKKMITKMANSIVGYIALLRQLIFARLGRRSLDCPLTLVTNRILCPYLERVPMEQFRVPISPALPRVVDAVDAMSFLVLGVTQCAVALAHPNQPVLKHDETK